MWKDIEGYEGIYKVSDSGVLHSYEKTVKHINSTRTIPGRELKCSKNKKGYLYTSLYDDNGVRKKELLHRLVAKTFLPLPAEHAMWKRVIVNHIDGNKCNNSVSNLEWCDDSHNNKHAYATGLKTFTDTQRSALAEWNIRKVGIPNMKLRVLNPEEEVTALNMYRDGKTLKDIALSFNVSQPTIGTIIRRLGESTTVEYRVKKLDITTNEVLEVYNSIAEASVDTCVNASTISGVCNGKRKSAGGFKWMKEILS